MIEGEFNFHSIFDNLPGWIRELDIESIRREAGIKTHKEQVPESDSLVMAQN